MVQTFRAPEVNNITREQLSLNPGDLSGDLVQGGTIINFASTGITDSATKQSLTIEDDKITVKTVKVDNLEGNVTVRGDVKIYGVLDAGLIRTTEISTNVRHEKQYLEFANPEGDTVGSGLLWSGGDYNRQLVYRPDPNRFFMTENVDIPGDKAFMVDGQPVLSASNLGNNVINSNLSSLGTLRKLAVSGTVNFSDSVFYNPSSDRFSVGTDEPSGKFTVYDYVNDVELIVSSNEHGRGEIGTYNTKPLDLITDHQVRISLEVNGDVTVGHEQKDSTVTRVYGKLGVGVKNPREQFEVAGNIRWANKLFSVGDKAPTEGSFTKGDVIWNSNPKPQSYIGWVCTAGGTPGEWSPFGLIAG